VLESFIDSKEIKKTYQHLMVDENFAKRLDKLSKEALEFDNKLKEMRSFAYKISVEEAHLAFPEYTDVFPEFKIRNQVGGETHISIYDSLIDNVRPDKAIIGRKNPNETQEYFVSLKPIQKGSPIMLEYSNTTKKLFDDFWERCHLMIENKSEVVEIRKKYPELIREKKIRKELVKRIQEPWDI
jgi:hypothetical protein